MRLFFLLILFSTLFLDDYENEPWQVLFDGETLSGWSQTGGVASFHIENGSIVGTTVANTPNSFLITDQLYADFILEYEVKLSDVTNSGVQIRSNSIPEFQNGRVHGYQVEIDPTERSWTGGIYDEARRGWLYPLPEMPEARTAYKHKEWNKFRVEAIGDTIKTWVNGIPVSHLVDDRTKKGFIGLQVHDIGDNKENEGITIRWRNLRILTDNPRNYTTSISIPAVNKYNMLTASQKNWGWELLYDGSSMKKWRGAKSNEFPESEDGIGWDYKEGTLVINESDGSESSITGDIVTREQYSKFELWVDFKITPGANSGIKYFVNTEINKEGGSAIGLEYQILDDDLHPDGKLGAQPGSRTVASLYDLIKAENKQMNSVGEWNHARIISDGEQVEHWLNGRKVLGYNRNSDEFRKLVKESKYKKWAGFGSWEDGNILLQDHGNEVHFRNIFIKRLD